MSWVAKQDVPSVIEKVKEGATRANTVLVVIQQQSWVGVGTAVWQAFELEVVGDVHRSSQRSDRGRRESQCLEDVVAEGSVWLMLRCW